VLACPGQKKGEVRITLYDSNKSLFLDAHTSAIACISVSLDGSIIATASTKGTLVRLFRSADGSKIQEVPAPKPNFLY
jgi:WD40 repeat protein